MHKVIILCGVGNNGGDGLAIGRILQKKGIDCTCLLINGMPTTDSGIFQYEALLAEGGRISIVDTEAWVNWEDLLEQAELIVDAIFGIGLNRNLSKELIAIVDSINKFSHKIWSVDCPSGLNATNGQIMGGCIKAAETITFIRPKFGLFINEGLKYSGKITCDDLGIPDQFITRKTKCNWFNENRQGFIRANLTKRDDFNHKYQFGNVHIIASSINMPGACLLSAMAAVHCGSGIVKIWSDEATLCQIRGNYLELIYGNVEKLWHNEIEFEEWRQLLKSHSIIFGPGLIDNECNLVLLERLLTHYQGVLVVDATGIKLLSKCLNTLKNKACRVVLTPHIGEMESLIYETKDSIIRDPFEISKTFSMEYGVTLLLKGPLTIITNAFGLSTCFTFPNSGLAKAGSGDVLSGIIGALVVNSKPMEENVLLAGLIHSLAGYYGNLTYGEYYLKASHLIEELWKVLKA